MALSQISIGDKFERHFDVVPALDDERSIKYIEFPLVSTAAAAAAELTLSSVFQSAADRRRVTNIVSLARYNRIYVQNATRFRYDYGLSYVAVVLAIVRQSCGEFERPRNQD